MAARDAVNSVGCPGRTSRVNNQKYLFTGIMPQGFQFPRWRVLGRPSRSASSASSMPVRVPSSIPASAARAFRPEPSSAASIIEQDQ